MFRIKKVMLEQAQQLGVFDALPLLSWVVECSSDGAYQTQYHVQLAKTPLFDDVLLDSGEVDSDESVNVKFADITLEASTSYFVRVKVWNNVGESTAWSEPKRFLTGLMSKWNAQFISPEIEDEAELSRCFYLRKKFDLSEGKHVNSAVIHMSACGIYKAFLNGEEVGQDELKPGCTSYKKNMLYQTYDVTSQISGNNVVAFHVAPGWYKGRFGFFGERNFYGNKSAIICQLVITYENGETQVVTSDDSWLATASPVIFSEIYDGETYDANCEVVNWLSGDINESDWYRPVSLDLSTTILNPQHASAVRRIEQIEQPKKIISPKGEVILDFGQNLSGFVEFAVNGKVGHKVVLEHFEVLDANGNAYFDNLRSAKQRIEYILDDSGVQSYCSNFSFQGFRYVRVTKYPGVVEPGNFKVHVIHSEMDQTSEFESSNALLNQLHKNIRWGMKSNFVDIPTDCPQRDERMGWTGDAQIFAKTASYLFNTSSFFSKWLTDLNADQLENGGVPHVIPDVLSGRTDHDEFLSTGTHSSAAWGDAAIIIPWTMYVMFANKALLARQYESMCAYVDFMVNNSDEYIFNYKLQFGDWVALDAKEGSYFGATPNDLTATAFFAYSTRLLAKTAKVLGYVDDERQYWALHDKVKSSFNNKFVNVDGSLKARTQTSHILCLHFDLVPDVFKPKVAEGLVALLAENNGSLNTGFVGTPYFCFALSNNGYVEEAYDLLLKETFPSWLHQVKQGATTIWEHWDGIKPDGTMWSPDMNSFNHYAYGSIGDWIYSSVLGIQPTESSPGFKKLRIKPLMTKKLAFAKGRFESNYGDICVEWKHINGDYFSLSITVPFNSSAMIEFDMNDQIVCSNGMTTLGSNVYEVGSGTYLFDIQKKRDNKMSVPADSLFSKMD
ncbi:family 78 glycoside hydrolase catalytic domain [Photobacterium sp. ZSDE20]|uniref:alpha-L-rhamnosidase n=1 Tax=Photobacterium pectinilyticum TaxID=2906793 RepID=A0ABT1N8F0_9GAMM|nr:family 78 glycoside hydrolase catalytic domain [Photobacterium sp. ZSDE20]MCQ1061039.1 family 78 glycoside hydrolase catalytic domain [Photobacterium sp. ZSDE20]MDD1829087.1 family 78 glycoside hydrolase catalytic domain [Photobacterium sp. ZSDE20]